MTLCIGHIRQDNDKFISANTEDMPVRLGEYAIDGITDHAEKKISGIMGRTGH